MSKQATSPPDLTLNTDSQPSTGQPVPEGHNSFVKVKEDMEKKIKKGKLQHDKVAAAGNLPVEDKTMSIKPQE